MNRIPSLLNTLIALLVIDILGDYFYITDVQAQLYGQDYSERNSRGHPGRFYSDDYDYYGERIVGNRRGMQIERPRVQRRGENQIKNYQFGLFGMGLNRNKLQNKGKRGKGGNRGNAVKREEKPGKAPDEKSSMNDDPEYKEFQEWKEFQKWKKQKGAGKGAQPPPLPPLDDDSEEYADPGPVVSKSRPSFTKGGKKGRPPKDGEIGDQTDPFSAGAEEELEEFKKKIFADKARKKGRPPSPPPPDDGDDDRGESVEPEPVVSKPRPSFKKGGRKGRPPPPPPPNDYGGSDYPEPEVPKPKKNKGKTDRGRGGIRDNKGGATEKQFLTLDEIFADKESYPQTCWEGTKATCTRQNIMDYCDCPPYPHEEVDYPDEDQGGDDGGYFNKEDRLFPNDETRPSIDLQEKMTGELWDLLDDQGNFIDREAAKKIYAKYKVNMPKDL